MIGYGGGMETAEKRDSEILLLLGTVNQNTDSNGNALKFFYSVEYFDDGATGSQYIVHNQDAFAMIDGKAASKNSGLPLFLGEHSLHAHLSGNFKSQDNAACSRARNHLDIVFLEVLGNELAEPLGIMRVLQNAEFLPVDR